MLLASHYKGVLVLQMCMCTLKHAPKNLRAVKRLSLLL